MIWKILIIISLILSIFSAIGVYNITKVLKNTMFNFMDMNTKFVHDLNKIMKDK